jgi:predicted nucleic acid-binding protein
MIFGKHKYCLDTNVLIEAWQKYYSPKFCPDYWNILNELGSKEIIFIPEAVNEEIIRTEDELSDWLKGSKIPIHGVTENVTESLQKIFAKDPVHQYLVDNTKARSLADPWVIAHAICEKATVVTKENKLTALNSNRIKIPNVCENMGVRWINDFDFVQELNLIFTCKIK